MPQALEFDRGLPMTVMDFLAALVANRPVFLSPKASVTATILAALAEVGMDGKAGAAWARCPAASASG